MTNDVYSTSSALNSSLQAFISENLLRYSVSLHDYFYVTDAFGSYFLYIFLSLFVQRARACVCLCVYWINISKSIYMINNVNIQNVHV